MSINCNESLHSSLFTMGHGQRNMYHRKINWGNFWQALCVRSCHEDLIFTRKSHNCSGNAFIQRDSAGGSNLIEQTLKTIRLTALQLV